MKNICIVESNVDILNLMADLLSYTYNVIKFNDSRESLTWLEKNGDMVDLLFLDINLPELNGLELGNKIKTLYPNLRILYTSGYMSHVDLEVNNKDFLIKPFTLRELKCKIEEILNN